MPRRKDGGIWTGRVLLERKGEMIGGTNETLSPSVTSIYYLTHSERATVINVARVAPIAEAVGLGEGRLGEQAPLGCKRLSRGCKNNRRQCI